MKQFFFIVFGLLLSFSLVRMLNGGEQLTLRTLMDTFGGFSLDVKEEFSVLIEGVDRVGVSCQDFIDSLSRDVDSSVFEDILTSFNCFFSFFFALGQLLVSVFVFLVHVFIDLGVLLKDLFSLLFGVPF